MRKVSGEKCVDDNLQWQPISRPFRALPSNDNNAVVRKRQDSFQSDWECWNPLQVLLPFIPALTTFYTPETWFSMAIPLGAV